VPSQTAHLKSGAPSTLRGVRGAWATIRIRPATKDDRDLPREPTAFDGNITACIAARCDHPSHAEAAAIPGRGGREVTRNGGLARAHMMRSRERRHGRDNGPNDACRQRSGRSGCLERHHRQTRPYAGTRHLPPFIAEQELTENEERCWKVSATN